jgi:hypothetical protein
MIAEPVQIVRRALENGVSGVAAQIDLMEFDPDHEYPDVSELEFHDPSTISVEAWSQSGSNRPSLFVGIGGMTLDNVVHAELAGRVLVPVRIALKLATAHPEKEFVWASYVLTACVRAIRSLMLGEQENRELRWIAVSEVTAIQVLEALHVPTENVRLYSIEMSVTAYDLEA